MKPAVLIFGVLSVPAADFSRLEAVYGYCHELCAIMAFDRQAVRLKHGGLEKSAFFAPKMGWFGFFNPPFGSFFLFIPKFLKDFGMIVDDVVFARGDHEPLLLE